MKRLFRNYFSNIGKNKTLKVEILSVPDDKNFIKNYAVSIVAIIISVVSVFISIYTSYNSAKSNEETIDRMDKDLYTTNKPILILSTLESGDSCEVVLWNSGPGVAYDINIETHLADNIGNVGNPWISDIIVLASQLETKDKETIYRRYNYIYNTKFSTNHPATLYNGIENGYKTSFVRYNAIDGLFAIIRYKDGLGNKYYSVFNGWSWQFGGENSAIRLPEYKYLRSINEDKEILYQGYPPITKFYYEMALDMEYGRTFPEVWDEWLEKDAIKLKEYGYGDIPNDLEETKKNVIEERNKKYLKNN